MIFFKSAAIAALGAVALAGVAHAQATNTDFKIGRAHV